MPSSLSTTLSSLSLTCLTPQARSTSVTQPSYSPLLPLSSSSLSSPFVIFIFHESVQIVVDMSLSSSKEHFCHVTVLLVRTGGVMKKKNQDVNCLFIHVIFSIGRILDNPGLVHLQSETCED